MSGDETMAAYRVVGWEQPPELVEVPVPTPGPGEVLVEVAGCGLCHSDLTMTAMPAAIGEALGWRVPFTLGHETAGRVVALGPEEAGSGVDAVGSGVGGPGSGADVAGPAAGIGGRGSVVGGTGAGVGAGGDQGGPAVGDAVALTSPSSCGACTHCRAGRESACPHGDTGRGYGRDGGLARYVVAPAREVLALGALDPRHAGPLTDAGATTFHAVRRARPALDAAAPGPDATVLVIGVGGLGAFAVQILRATTDARIVAVDPDPARRAVATDLGADEVLDHVRGAEVDAVIDIVGTDETIRRGLRALRRGGAFVLVGAGGGGFARPWMGGLPREATVTSIQGSTIADARAVIGLAAAGHVRVHAQEFPLADVEQAYAALAAGTLTGRAVVVP